MKKITIWNRLTKKKHKVTEEVFFEKEHNHYEDGWADNSKPLPNGNDFGLQKSWKSFEWIREYGWLVNDGTSTILKRDDSQVSADSRNEKDLKFPVKVLV